jgi:cadmium resistance protein CadD (predicted permease)
MEALLEVLLALIITATVAYTSTNVDGYVLLLGFVSDRRYGAKEVVAGQFTSVALQLTISLAIAQSGRVMGGPSIGLVGLVPFIVGLARIAQCGGRMGASGEEDSSHTLRSRNRALGRTATVCAVATSGAIDNIFVYASVLIGRPLSDAVLTACLFTVLTAALCLCAYATVSARGVFRAVRLAAGRVAPFVTTAIGLSVLIRFDTLPWLCSLV